MNECQCEHECHFGDLLHHAYGAKMPDFQTAVVRTSWGRFVMCDNCREAGHMIPYLEVTQL